jgi:ketosteroid isomerase-like protein
MHPDIEVRGYDGRDSPGPDEATDSMLGWLCEWSSFTGDTLFAMDRRDLELLRDMYGARSLREFARSLHPHAEMRQAREIPDTADYYGRDDFVRGVRRWLEEWDDFEYRPEEVIDCGERALMRVRLSGRARASGLTLEQTIWHVWTFRDGMPWRCEVLWSEPEARTIAELGE